MSGIREQFIDIYAVAEYRYCKRAAFYMVTGSEDGQEENLFIHRGRTNHALVNIPGKRYRANFSESKSVSIKNYEYLIKGKADLIRFYKDFAIPVEYKSGNFKVSEFHKFQLFLQGICIEEQFKIPVLSGAVYFYQENKIQLYDFSTDYRELALETIEEFRIKLEEGVISGFTQLDQPNCINCSFYDICMPFINKKK